MAAKSEQANCVCPWAVWAQFGQFFCYVICCSPFALCDPDLQFDLMGSRLYMQMNNIMQNKIFLGDNLKILSSDCMREFKNNIKMIYIDPPYNTKNRKSYDDDLDSGIWLNNMEKVIASLFDYLGNDGVIFFSIDDNEYAALKLLCDKIFEKRNFIGAFITRQAQRSNSKFINIVHEYVLCYAKNKSRLNKFRLKRCNIPEQRAMIEDIATQVKKEMTSGERRAKQKLKQLIDYYCSKYDISWLKNYNCVDENGDIYFPSDLSVPGMPRTVDIPRINLKLKALKTRGWVSDQKFIELYERSLLVFRKGRPYQKKFLYDAEDNVPSILNFYSRFGTKDLEKLGLQGLFDTPKPVELIKFLIRIANVKSGDYVLDCYAGSGATGQAVIEINFEDKLDIGYILIQKKEKVANSVLAEHIKKKFKIEPLVSEIIKLRLGKVYEIYSVTDKAEFIDY